MIRVSTAFSHYSAMLNIQQSQSRMNQHLQEVGTGRLGDDLKAFANRAETLIASRNVQVRTETHIANGKALGARLTVQDAALGKVQQGAEAAMDAVTKALANNDGGTLMTALQSAMDQVVSGLNTTYSGSYLFSGGRIDTAPVAITALADLDDPPPLPPPIPPVPPTPRPNPFTNGDLVGEHRLDDDTKVKTGVLANDVAGPLFDALADVAALQPAGSGEPLTDGFGAPLTPEQRTFLEGLLSKLSGAANHATNVRASNGSMQKRVETTTEDMNGRKDMIEDLMSGITDADPLEAAARLEQARTTLQAAAKAFTVLQESSLLNMLSR
ncbi:MAG TPA: flagellin [Phenylobacterium sp.]|nr:flagellin [Phenylobacterium sp.]